MTSIFFFFLLFSCIAAICADLVLLKKLNKMWCVARGDTAFSALTWVSVSDPSLAEKEFNMWNTSFGCNLMTSECESWRGWTRVNSLKHPVSSLLDYRWNSLPVVVTADKNDYNMANNMIEYEGGIGQVIISVLARSNAFIALCEDSNPHGQACYWIILGGWFHKGGKSVIRKCPNGVPSKQTKSNCEELNGSCAAPGKAISLNKWTHFTIIVDKRTPNELTLRVSDDNYDILECTDGNKTLNIHYFYVGSNLNEGRFRIQNYDFLQGMVNEELTREFEASASETQHCWSILYSFEAEAGERPFLEVKLRSLSHEERIIAKLSSTEGNWRREQILHTLDEAWSNTATLVITGKEGHNSFAVGGIEKCNPKGDILTSKELMPGPRFKDDVSCQALDLNQTLRFTKLDFDFTDCEDCSLNCKDFGIPAFSAVQTCMVVQLCQNTKANENVCFCSAGYQGEFCQQFCSKRYGVNCKGQCGKCRYGNQSCNLQTGVCSSGCEPGYRWPLCQKIYPVLIDPPEYYGSTPTSITVYRKNNRTNGEGDPVSYTLQFKITDGLHNWTSYTTHDVNLRPLIEVKGLRYATKYAFRAILTDRDHGNYSEDDVPFAVFETKCQHPNSVDVSPSSRSIIVSWQEIEYPCPIMNYGLEFDKSYYHPIKLRFEVTGLTPNELYEWKLLYNGEIIFGSSIQTLEDLPSAVRDLAVTEVNQTTLIMSWNTPKNPNGDIRHYRIAYQYCSSLACPYENCETRVEKILDPRPTSAALDGLKAFSRYNISVAASTIDYGEEEAHKAKTRGFGVLKLSPQFENEPKIKEREIRVNWTDPQDCSTINGKISGYQVTLKGLSEWVSTVENKVTVTDHYYDFKNLVPHSYYEVHILIKGEVSLSDEEFAIRKEMKTKPAAPPKVRNAVAYAYGDSWIHLRWNKPYPPYGELGNFQLAYRQDPTHNSWTVNIDENCDLWEEMICGKIEGLRKNIEYEIEISARNKDVKELGERETLKIRTTEGVPDRPGNVVASAVSAWELMLTWEHPNITRGQLQSFRAEITLSSTGLKNRKTYKETKELAVEKDKKVYTMKVRDLHPASEYRIAIYGVTHSSGENNTVFGKTLVAVPEIGSYLEYDPQSITNTTFKILVPAADEFVTDESGFIIIVTSESPIPDQEVSHSFKGREEEKIILTKAGVSSWTNSWVAAELQPGERKQFEIGNNETQDNGGHFVTYSQNRPLTPGGSYKVTLVALYNWNNESKAKAIKLQAPVQTLFLYVIPEEPSVVGWVILVLLLICISVGIAFFVLRRKNTMKKKEDSVELRGPAIIEPDNHLTTEVEPYEPQLPPSQRFSRRVAIGELEQYIRTGILSGELQRQHALFPRGQTRPWDYGKLPENKSKNRYGNLVAYDETRVKLKKFPGDPFSDYINANYINGYNSQRFYIATQGPKRNTVVDFWRMVWQEHVQVIVMLANTVENGKTKCEQYWPEFGQEVTHGAVSILNASNQIFADYTFRLLNVTCKGKIKKIHHLHFTSWPDHGVPLYTQSVSSFLKKLLATPPGAGPMVVHCSAGVGRTGSIILSDICLRMAAAEGSVDILGFQQQIREQRANMVDNLDQYKLVHMILLECLVTDPSSYPCDKDFENQVKELSTSGAIERQFNHLGSIRWQDEVLKPTSGDAGISPAQKDKFKNRDLSIVPGRNGRVFVSSFPFDNPYSNYINAVYVDGFRAKDQFVVTQFPLQSTVGDFWRLIHEKNISLIVVLNEIDEAEEQSICNFWPLEEKENLKPMPHFTVSKKQENNFTYWKIYSLQLTVEGAADGDDEKRSVNVLHLKDWRYDENLPPSTSVILELWQEAERLCSGKAPIVVCCLDGASASGFFVALAFLIEKIKLEQQCDVCQAVRTVRQNREQFVATCEQFEYLYKAALMYLDTFKIYANFS